MDSIDRGGVPETSRQKSHSMARQARRSSGLLRICRTHARDSHLGAALLRLVCLDNSLLLHRWRAHCHLRRHNRSHDKHGSVPGRNLSRRPAGRPSRTDRSRTRPRAALLADHALCDSPASAAIDPPASDERVHWAAQGERPRLYSRPSRHDLLGRLPNPTVPESFRSIRDGYSELPPSDPSAGLGGEVHGATPPNPRAWYPGRT